MSANPENKVSEQTLKELRIKLELIITSENLAFRPSIAKMLVSAILSNQNINQSGLNKLLDNQGYRNSIIGEALNSLLE